MDLFFQHKNISLFSQKKTWETFVFVVGENLTNFSKILEFLAKYSTSSQN
jgi:hypothetical protein